MKQVIAILVPIFFLHNISQSQVKIGGSPSTPINASSILHIDDSSKGFLMPVMNVTRRDAIVSPAEGLLIYNKSSNNINLFSSGSWRGVNTDTSEWKFDTASKRVYLVRAKALNDTVYYDTSSHKFNFTDKFIYTNSLNQDIPADAFGGKFLFKATASKSRDSITAATSALIAMYEADNDADMAFTGGNYSAISAITTVNPKAFQKPNSIVGISNNTLNAGNDTAFFIAGTTNVVNNRSIGYTDLTYGIQNQISISAQNTGNFGTVYGISNVATRSAAATGRIQGNYYGYYNVTPSAVASRVDGTAYGIFLSNAPGAALGNYAIFTNTGRNRFGDSVLIGSATVPRAFVDINNTSSMIIPTGSTAQRPVAGVIGMFRYNVDNATPEAYTGTAWINVKNPVIASTATLDPPLIANNTTGTVNYTFTGVALGNTVTISPAAALPSGVVIAWANISAANQVTIGFANFSGTSIDLPAQTFYIKVVQ